VRRDALEGPDQCEVQAPPPVALESTSIAFVVPDSAPAMGDLMGRFVAAHAFETLVEVDCAGNVVPRLAVSWAADASRMRWTFTLRSDARFWSGDRVTAADVVASWRRVAGGESSTGGHDRSDSTSASIARRLLESAAILDERTLSLTMTDSDPRFLADPALSVSRARSGESTVEGTGPFRLAGPRDASGGTSLIPVAVGAPRLTIVPVPAARARDRIDSGIDVLVTGDPAIADYAAARGDVRAVPLPWERTFVLLLATRSAELRVDPDSLHALGTALATDAVRADAVASAGTPWWSSASTCALDRGRRFSSSGSTPRRRVVYERHDEVARGLAERIAALASMGGSGSGGSARLAAVAPELVEGAGAVRSVGLGAKELADAIATGRDLAYVVALPKRSLAPCRDLATLRVGATSLALERRIVPLIDVRRRVLVRPGSVGVRTSWDGTVRVVTPTGSARP
jgi:hypothetical protein